MQALGPKLGRAYTVAELRTLLNDKRLKPADEVWVRVHLEEWQTGPGDLSLPVQYLERERREAAQGGNDIVFCYGCHD
jgi:hypothetical protein